MNAKSRTTPRNSMLVALAGAALLTTTAIEPTAAQIWSPELQKIVVPGSPLVQIDASTLVPDRGPNGPLPGTVLGTGVPGTSSGSWPAWSPDGKKLAFLAGVSKLTVLDTTSHESITPDSSAISPVAWSPDSKFLAYVRNDDKGALELRTIHDNGDMALSVALPFSKLAVGTMATIAWVPATDNVIVAGGDGGKVDLYLIDQGQVVPLTTTGDVLGFAVSASGGRVRWIMRSRNTHYILFSIYDLQINKRNLSKLDFPDRLSAVNPLPRKAVDAVVSAVISPDLRQIAFITRGGPASGQNGVALFVTDIAGKRVLQAGRVQSQPSPPAKAPPATGDGDGPPAPPALPAPVGAGSAGTAVQTQESSTSTTPFLLPVFSPDSRQLAFVRIMDERRYLSIIHLDNGQRSIGLLP